MTNHPNIIDDDETIDLSDCPEVGPEMFATAKTRRKYHVRTDAVQISILAESAHAALQAIIEQECIDSDALDDGAFVVATAADGTDSASIGQPF